MGKIVSLNIYGAMQEFNAYLKDNPEHIVINFHKNHVSLYCQHCFHQEIIKSNSKNSIINQIGNYINEHELHEELEDIDDESENIEFVGEDFGVYRSRGNKKSDNQFSENIIPFKKRSC